MWMKYHVQWAQKMHMKLCLVPHTASGNVQISCSKKCDPSHTSLGISQPRKFKISSSDNASHSQLRNVVILKDMKQL